MSLSKALGHSLRRLTVAALSVLAAACATAPTEKVSIPALPAPGTPPSTAAVAKVVEFRIAAVGDIMLGGSATPEMQKYGYDYPFELLSPILKQAQIVFGNLEGPLTDDGAAITTKQYLFRSPPDKVAPALARAGFNIVSLANNHSLDYGAQGLDDTRAALDKVGIRVIGAGRNLAQARAPVYMQAGGAKIAFLAYSLTFPEEFWATPDKPGTAFGHEHFVRADVAAARAQADIVLVSFHWGQEGKIDLRDYQVQLAHAAIDAGAVAVLGHHPHILQGVERYKDGVILYSLGNFVFGSYSAQATRSAIAMLTFRDKRLSELRMLPINVKNAEVVFQSKPLAGADANQVIEQLQQMAQERGTLLRNHNGAAVLTLEN
ncbi:MAG: CapA family protein [Gammaproteobacteria bacterium]|nr:CapA family protein [Gammaproteobacteria bacterium]